MLLFSGELVDGETQSYFKILDSDEDGQISEAEMRAGVDIMNDQCETLTDISAESFSQKNCFDGEVCQLNFPSFAFSRTFYPLQQAQFEEFKTCLKALESEHAAKRRRR